MKKKQIEELSYYGLLLLSYLQESHPQKAKDVVFIKARADEASEAYSNAIKEGLSHPEAEELATTALYKDLYFSRHDTIVTVLWNEFDRFIPLSEAGLFARRIQPECENIFGKYLLSDEFMYSPEYNNLYTELVGFIDFWLEENEL